jgi:hypothetical protein
MSSTFAKAQQPESPATQPLPGETGRARGVIAWSSFFFALLQSVCTFFFALDGVRLLLGITSLAVSAGVGAAFDRFHTDWIRVPMISFALFGSLANLALLYQIRRLRRRPASQWRQQPVSRHKLRMERLQFVLSIATLVLVGVEEYLHFLGHRHL